MSATTPMMRQYYEIKETVQDCILFFRLGDFYEMFGDDAKTVSKELDLVLTSRDRSVEDPDARIPMCGIPYHSSEGYIARLITKGFKVAICEQLEDPAAAKGLVERGISRVVTPGTLIESSMLDEGIPNYLCSAYITGAAAMCFCDLSTGEISVTEFVSCDMGHMENELSAFSPREVILGGDPDAAGRFLRHSGDDTKPYAVFNNELFSEKSAELTLGHFGADACAGLSPQALAAIGALLSYLIDTQKTDISHIRTLRRNLDDRFMELDFNTVRNLELVSSAKNGDKRGSLLWVLDKTKTPMGRRLLRSWVLRPLIRVAPIKRRLSAVSELASQGIARSEIILHLKSIGDMERLIARVVYGSAGCRELKALASYIRALPAISALLNPMKSDALRGCREIDELTDVADLIDGAIKDDPPFSVREGGFIKNGVDTEVDRLRALLENSSDALTGIETREKERTGKRLKVGYNRVFGYYIEIPRGVSDDVPADYIRKQTLANCERFITDELKTLETELLSAKDTLCSLEYNLFEALRRDVAAEVGRVQTAAGTIAELDALCSLSETAVQNNYCNPELDVSGVLHITAGRHPVVELMQKDSLFVPNDTFLNDGKARSMIITGPNMAGKSTYMRQTALIVLMAQMGSFVPAKSAQVGIIDRVFTRIGASDDLSGGKSTFMVEMTEVADILKDATSRSLLILDEIGRGTSTYDGMSVARAVLEHCADKRKLGAKTLFSTHYHELSKLDGEIDGVMIFNISAKKRGGDIIFLRKIVPGGTDDSFGIEVAGLAGVPESVIKRSKAVLKMLESASPEKSAPARESGCGSGQLSMLDLGGSNIAARLQSTDLNTLSPLEALNLLFEMKKNL